MRCAFCHNPDTWDPAGGRTVWAESLIEEYKKYEGFTKRGGVTATGGEPLLQIAFLTELFRLAKKNNIHTCLDTSGILFTKARRHRYDRLMEYVDLVLLDIKHMQEQAHWRLTGCSNEAVLAFAEYLNEKGIETWIRRVLVPGITDDAEELRMLGAYFARHKNVKAFDLIPYHKMGVQKYDRLGIPYLLSQISEASAADIAAARAVIQTAYENNA